MKCEKKYRILEIGELVKANDEFQYADGFWRKTLYKTSEKYAVPEFFGKHYRREIKNKRARK